MKKLKIKYKHIPNKEAMERGIKFLNDKLEVKEVKDEPVDFKEFVKEILNKK